MDLVIEWDFTGFSFRYRYNPTVLQNIYVKLRIDGMSMLKAFCSFASLFCHTLTGRRQKGPVFVFGLQGPWKLTPGKVWWDTVYRIRGNQFGWVGIDLQPQVLNKSRLHHRLGEWPEFSLLVEIIRGTREEATVANLRKQGQMAEFGQAS